MCLPITNDISRNVRSGEVRRTFNIVEKERGEPAGINFRSKKKKKNLGSWESGILLLPAVCSSCSFKHELIFPYVKLQYHLYIYSRSPITGNAYAGLVPMRVY